MSFFNLRSFVEGWTPVAWFSPFARARGGAPVSAERHLCSTTGAKMKGRPAAALDEDWRRGYTKPFAVDRRLKKDTILDF